jgi:hypothetical protein
MRREKRLGEKISAAGMPHARQDPHFFCHCGVGRFSLHCSTGILRLPGPL